MKKRVPKKRSVAVWFAAALVLAALALLGQLGRTRARDEAGEAGKAERTVSFLLRGETLQRFTLAEGESLPACESALTGLSLDGWLDEAGERVDPWAESLQGERVFTAVVRLALPGHSPFLFPDENGFLNPDAPLDDRALAAALEALLPPGGEEELRALRWELTALAGESASRRDFARAILQSLGWTPAERLLSDASAVAPPDLDRNDADFALLLEASVPHRADDGGLTWPEQTLSTGREEGILLCGDELYCVGADGFLLRDASLGPLYFGADGRYLSGDEALDERVKSCLAALRQQFPADAADRAAMLRHAYDFVRDGFSYQNGGSRAEGVDWRPADARTLFDTGAGDGGCFAAAFCALARQLGYPANVVCRGGEAGDGLAWTDIILRGYPYVFDPLAEKQGVGERYMLRYEALGSEGYRRPDPAVFLGYDAYADMSYHQPPERQGTVVAEYAKAGETYLVCLPDGYDPAKQYRVLIYLNGADGTPYKMLGTDRSYGHDNTYFHTWVNTKYYLDYLIQEGYCDPLIVVSTDEIIAPWIGDRYLRLLQYTVDNFSTYAASSSVEDLVAARDYFAIAGPSNAAQSICAAIQTMPDVFAYYGLFSGMYQPEATLAAFREKGEIQFLMMAAGDEDYQSPVMQEAYATYSQLDNVKDSFLMIVPRANHDWTAFDAAIRYMLFYFSPCTGREQGG